MISNVEILYGLANRCHKYGIKKNISKASLNPLDSILGTIVTGLVLSVILVFIAKAIAGV